MHATFRPEPAAALIIATIIGLIITLAAGGETVTAKGLETNHHLHKNCG